MCPVIAYEGPNAEQIRYWNDVVGPEWVALESVLSAQLRPLGLRALERLGVRPGERVLDIGCGGGETTAEIARRVGPSGRVLGVDISEPLGVVARRHTAEFSHADIRIADAQTTEFEPESFNAMFSRFGIMFFSDPDAAFSNLRRALRPDGRMTFICWRDLSENPWMALPAMATAQHLPLKRPEPNAPGPFAFANVDRVRGILERTGFVQIQHEPLDEPVCLAEGQSLDAAITFVMRLGPSGAALRENPVEPVVVEAIRSSIREALAPFSSPRGVVMPSGTWIVSAQRGD
jgi:SAM-dependent methyltransferase